MTKSRLYFIFNYDKLLFWCTIMGLTHRLSVIKISSILKYREAPIYMNDCSCICVIGQCMNYIMPLDPVFIYVFAYI